MKVLFCCICNEKIEDQHPIILIENESRNYLHQCCMSTYRNKLEEDMKKDIENRQEVKANRKKIISDIVEIFVWLVLFCCIVGSGFFVWRYGWEK